MMAQKDELGHSVIREIMVDRICRLLNAGLIPALPAPAHVEVPLRKTLNIVATDSRQVSVTMDVILLS